VPRRFTLQIPLGSDLRADVRRSSTSIPALGKKQRRCTPEDGIEKGDQYIFLGMSSSSKAIISYQVGKRNEDNTKAFLWDPNSCMRFDTFAAMATTIA
jgi:hypothetical protein